MRLNTPSKTPRDDSKCFISAEVFVEIIIETVAFLIMIFNLIDSNILEECDGSMLAGWRCGSSGNRSHLCIP